MHETMKHHDLNKVAFKAFNPQLLDGVKQRDQPKSMMRYQILDNWVHLNSALINDQVVEVNFSRDAATGKNMSQFSSKVNEN
jgi:hypothetical protein